MYFFLIITKKFFHYNFDSNSLFLFIKKMSLLDQLSSFCVSGFNNYNSTLFSFDDNLQLTSQSTNQPHPTPNILSQQSLSNPIQSQFISSQNNSQSSKKQQNHPPAYLHQSSERKMIRLFDDQQINQPRFIKTDKKRSIKKTFSQQQQSSQVQLNFQPFITPLQFQPITYTNSQNLQIKLTKISYLIKNKLQKLNYQFFVKLEQYNKCLMKEKQEQQRQKMRVVQIQQNKKRQIYNKNICRLVQTIDIINLKYIESNKLCKTQIQSQNNRYRQQDLLDLTDAFQQIKRSNLIQVTLNKIQLIVKKVFYRQFFKNIQHNKKINMKIQLFCISIEGFLDGKKKMILKESWKGLKLNDDSLVNRGIGKQDNKEKVKYEQQLYQQLRKEDQICQGIDFSSINKIHQQQQQVLPIINQQFQVKLTQSYPLSLPKSKIIQIKSIQEFSYSSSFQSTQLNFQNPNHRFEQQNIPIKLNHLKSHEQQININDCIDNGHLMMNQMKSNKGFYQELQNLTISKINCHSHTNNNSSLNSSVLGYGQFILPEPGERNLVIDCHQNRKSIQNNQIKMQQEVDNKDVRNIFMKNRNIQVQSQRECNRAKNQVEISSSQDINSYSLLTTMRKPNNIQQTCCYRQRQQQLQQQQNEVQKTMKNIKKPRSSLIITKRKSSSIQDSHSLQRFSLFQRKVSSNSTHNNQQKQNIKKSIQPTTSPNPTPNPSQILHNQKQIIKKMLQQLNKKYDFHNKNIQINITHKKAAVPVNKKDSNKNSTNYSQQENCYGYVAQDIIQKKLGQRNKKCKSQLCNQFNQDMAMVKQFRKANNLSEMNNQFMNKQLVEASSSKQKYSSILSSSTKKQLYFKKQLQNISNKKKDSKDSNKKQEQVYTINLLTNSSSAGKKHQNKHSSNTKTNNLASNKKQIIQKQKQKMYYSNKNSNIKDNQGSSHKNSNNKHNNNKIQRIHSSRKVSCYNYNDQNQENYQYIKKQKKVSSFQKSNKLLITKSVKQGQKKNSQASYSKKHEKKNTFMSITLLDNKTTKQKQKTLSNFIQKKKTSTNSQQPEQKSFFISQKPSNTLNLKRMTNNNNNEKQNNILFTFQKPFFKESDYLDLDRERQNLNNDSSLNNNQQSFLFNNNKESDYQGDNSIIKQYINYIPSSYYVLLPLSSQSQSKNPQNQQDTSLFNIKQSIQIPPIHFKQQPLNYTSQKQNTNQQLLNNTNLSYISGVGAQQYYTGTGSMCKSTSKKSNIKQSLQKKRQLFQKSRQQWQSVLQKKKSKLIRQNSYQKVIQKLTHKHKNSSSSSCSPSEPLSNQPSQIKLNNISNMELIKKSQKNDKSYDKYQNNNKSTNYFKTKRSSLTLNESIINQIKSKIQQCGGNAAGNRKGGNLKNGGGSIVKLFN